MDTEICRNFVYLTTKFPDNLVDGKYNFVDDVHFKEYCYDNCNNNIGKINAVSLYLFNEFFGESSSFKNHNKINIVEYIMIWLSYMLSLIENNDNSVSNLDHFFKVYIDGGSYYNSYKNLIEKKKYFLNMDKSIISKFYNAFKSLCNLYTQIDKDNHNCMNYLKDDNEFNKNYEKLKNDSNITKNESYRQLLSTLLNDYNNLKNKCNGTSFPSIASKLFIVLSIFGAIGIFLGVSYKVNNKEFKNYFHYIYPNVNKQITRFLTFYISIRYLDFGKKFKNKN
ncbi:putative yir3 protein [Plasmodium yoelii yoelii]|uniref:Yir3 protein n=1 Tax=Plasmodium yoelii yoelii TaxID=73239 RepID=Q7RRG2_PLAYO|nr:putative yir3 protein [Plasmodium yoelii yoelii]